MMKQKLILPLFVFSLALALESNAQIITRIDGSKISADSLGKRISYLVEKAKLSGLNIAVFNNNNIVYKQSFGYANVPEKRLLKTSTVLYGASLSKAVFAYTVMQLVQDKIIDLDKPLEQYLPKPLPAYDLPPRRGYQDLKEESRLGKITARMCLDHTTGFPNWRWFEEDKKLKIKFEPGTRYSYSGEGLSLLQFVIEQITGKGLEMIAQEKVFVPLGMSNTSYVWQERFATDLCLAHDATGKPYEFNRRGRADAAGSMNTTLDDYSKFFTALLQQKGLNKEGFKEMFSPQVRIRSKKQFGPGAWVDSTGNDNIQLSYGLGYGVFKTPYGSAFFKEGHDDGWGHYTIGFPAKGIGMIIMNNNDTGEGIFKELLALAIGDTFSPWYWENYIPYNY